MASFSAAFISICLVHSSLGCSFVPGKEPRRYTAQEVLYLAPIVVSGTIIALDEVLNEAMMNISCVYKTDDVNMPTVVVIIEGTARSTCRGTEGFEGNMTYLVALEPATGDDQGKYEIAEPEDLAKAAWDVDELGVRTLATICDIAPANVTLSDADFVQDCPTLPDPEECFVFRQFSGAWRGVIVHTGVMVVICVLHAFCMTL